MVFKAGRREYVLQGKIGDGAVGLVRKARDRASDRVVAVKVLAPDPKYIDVNAFDNVAHRFKREGTRGAALKHQHLVEVLAYEDNTVGECFRGAGVKNPLIVMEYVRGRTLESLIKNLGRRDDGRLHITPQTLTIAQAVCEALLYLHERKLVHRDVKPPNIFLSAATPNSVPATVKLGDFGVTKWGDFLAAASTGTLTVSTQKGLGTLKYMSPEQALKPKDVTVRSDMFCLGITLFELFTGEILLSPHHVFEIMTARNMRASITGKLYSLGIPKTDSLDETIMERVLEMFTTPKRRPTSVQMAGRFAFWLERFQRSSED